MQALKFLPIWSLLLLSPVVSASQPDRDESLQALAAEFFEWRRVQQPVSGDDIPRVERPEGWVPDFSPGALDKYRERYHAFLQAVDQLDTQEWNIANQVDARLLKAAIERLHWELDIL